MARKRVRGVHASLKHDVDPTALADYLADLVETYRLDVLTTTESRDPALARALRRRLRPEYRVVRRHEYLQVWRREAFAGGSKAARLVTASPILYWMLGKLQRRFLVASQRLRHRSTRRPFRVMVGHAPSGVDGGRGRWRPGALAGRVPSARRGFRRWGRRVSSWQRRHRAGVQVLAADSNIDQRQPEWRRYLTRELGGISIWEAHPPGRGTHGPRAIDTVHVVGDGVDVVDGRVLDVKRPRGVDHAPVLWVIEIDDKEYL